MTNKIEGLRLLAVEREEDYKATLKLADLEKKLFYDVNFNKREFDRNAKKWISSPEKEAKVEEKCLEYVGFSFDDLEQAVGGNFDVYEYEEFNSLWEVQFTKKFQEEHKGKSFQTTIDEIEDNGTTIVIKYQWKGEPYQSKMTYADYVEDLKEWFVNPQKRKKQLEKFNERYGIPFEQKDDLIGSNIIVNVKCAFGKFYYGEITLLEEL